MDLNLVFDKYRDRIVTGAALIAAFVILGVIDNFFLIWLVMGALFMLSFHEATRLFKIEHNALYIYAVLLWIAALFYPYPNDLLFIGGLVFASVVAYTNKGEWKYFLPFLYPAAGFLFMLSLYINNNMVSIFWLAVVVVSVDIGAFIVGKSIGRTPFSPTSPNKTLEGVLGGIVVATVLGFFIGVAVVDIDKALIISFLVAIASVFGDLFESFLKRRADVKDSGNILPGHGGILDRLDGFLFAAVALEVLLRGLV